MRSSSKNVAWARALRFAAARTRALGILALVAPGCATSRTRGDNDSAAGGHGAVHVSGSSEMPAGRSNGMGGSNGGASDDSAGEAANPNGQAASSNGGDSQDESDGGTGGATTSASGGVGGRDSAGSGAREPSGGTGLASGTGGSGAGAGAGAGGGAVHYSGNWTGRYSASDEYGLSFLVDESGTMRAITLTDSSSSCGGTGLVEGVNQGPIVIGPGGDFEAVVIGCGKAACFTDHLVGQLSGDGTAQGTLIHYGACGLTGCTSVVSGSTGQAWSAATSCALRPTAGVSASRFCDEAGMPRSDSTGAMATTLGGTTCSVTPSGSGGTSGQGAGGSSGAGGRTGNAGSGNGGAPVDYHLGEQCGDVGCPPVFQGDECSCTDGSTDCLTMAYYWVQSDACGGGRCVGNWSSTKQCSAPCETDQDCDNPTLEMHCLTACPGFPALEGEVTGLCWPVDAFAFSDCK